ncbi:MAG: isoprenylcysteine carboxylmethyltransferase family protein [Candidatus Margulisbacteria bacterium]|jgi:protein-S-isoprenylcysteine O-methyltransferase Ste14|nr:isoprenylcysteine carboxylmethyltransferase family protein [Candidatus Margulisiibacteriota bacterium]
MIDILVIISLLLFYGLFIGRTVLLYKWGIKVVVIGVSAKKFAEKILEKILLPVLALWSIFVIITACHLELPGIISHNLVNILWLKYLGLTICYAGLIIFLLALLAMGKSWRIGLDETNTNELVTTGIFKHTRNPIFVFLDLYFLGIMLIYPNIIFSLIALGAVIGIHLQILREEASLTKRFGEKYLKYKKAVRRYI